MRYFSTLLADFYSREKDNFFLWIPVLLAIGIAFYFGMTTETPIWIGLTCLFISGLTTYYLRNYYIVFLSTLALSIIIAGFSSAQIRTYYLGTKVLPYSVGPAAIQGRIVKTSPTDDGIKLVLDNLQIARLRADHIPTRLRLHVNNPKHDFKTGQWIETRAMLKPPPQPSSPHGFDFQRHAYFQQIGAIGFTYGQIDILSEESGLLTQLFDNLRHDVQARIRNVLHENPDVESLAITLLSGNKGVIDEDTHETVRRAGLAHLLAISGLHIGLVCAIFFFSIRFILALIPPIALRYPIKKWAAVFAIFATLFFTLLTGASIPTIRAFLMTGIILCGVLLDRKALSLRSVAWAAILILLVFPESLLGASFQLSFAAVTALIAFYEYHKPSKERPKWYSYFQGLTLSSLIASLATTPYGAYHFNRIAVWGIGANLLAIPLTVFWIMPVGLLALALMPLGLESPALIVMGWGISGLLWVAEQTANLPFSQISIPAMTDLSIALITLAGLILCLFKSKTRHFAAALLLFAFVDSALQSRPDILITADARLSAVRTENGTIALSNIRNSAYARESWLKRWGQEENKPQIFETELPCDTHGCLFNTENGQKIAFNKSSLALMEDCLRADLLITTQNTPQHCSAPTNIIAANDLKTKGAHAVYITPNGIKIETVRDVRGTRPWTIYGR